MLLNIEMDILIESPRMAQCLADAFDTTLAAMTYRPALTDDGRFVCEEGAQDGVVRHEKEPCPTVLSRSALRFLDLLPIEGLRISSPLRTPTCIWRKLDDVRRRLVSHDPDPIDVFVGERLRVFRLSRRLSLEELGRRVGVSYQQMQKYELGANRVSASQMWRLSRALGIDVGGSTASST